MSDRFLEVSVAKAFEGKYVRWSDGDTRLLQLVSHKVVEKESSFKIGEKYNEHQITALDIDSGEEKMFTANKNFMAKLARLNHKLKNGSIIKVTPRSKQVTFSDGTSKTVFDFDIELNETSTEEPKL